MKSNLVNNIRKAQKENLCNNSALRSYKEMPMPIIYYPWKGLDISNDDLQNEDVKRNSFNMSDFQFNKIENPYWNNEAKSWSAFQK